MPRIAPAYYRARISAIEHWLKVSPFLNDEKKNNDRVLLRNGVIPENNYYALEESIANRLHHNKHLYSDEPLTLTELTSYSTWFAMHPEKIAGKEEVTTSLHFPITIKGNREQIEQTISAGIEAAKNNFPGPQQQNMEQETARKKQIAKFKLKAKLMLLETISGELGNVRKLSKYTIAKNCSDIQDVQMGLDELKEYFKITKKPTDTAYIRFYKLKVRFKELNGGIVNQGLNGFQIDRFHFPFIPKYKKEITGRSKNIEFLIGVVKKYMLRKFKNKVFPNPDTGFDILIHKEDSIGKMFNKNIRDKKLKAYTVLDEIILVAKKYKEEPGEKKNIIKVHFFASIVSVEGHAYPFLFTVNEKTGKQYIYNTIFIDKKIAVKIMAAI